MPDKDASIVRLSCEQVRRIDRLAVEQLEIQSIVLMENAGANAARAIQRAVRRRLKVTPDRMRVAIVCGGGNNGGDGYVIARHLAIEGAQVHLYAAKDPDALDGDAAVNATIARHMGLPIERIEEDAALAAAAGAWGDAHVLVDALLGTGFRGSLRPHMRAVIERINFCGASLVVAVDIPSGLDGDSGAAPSGAVRADLTVTFVALKRGFAAVTARVFLGRVVVAGIGVPPALVQQVLVETDG